MWRNRFPQAVTSFLFLIGSLTNFNRIFFSRHFIIFYTKRKNQRVRQWPAPRTNPSPISLSYLYEVTIPDCQNKLGHTETLSQSTVVARAKNVPLPKPDAPRNWHLYQVTVTKGPNKAGHTGTLSQSTVVACVKILPFLKPASPTSTKSQYRMVKSKMATPRLYHRARQWGSPRTKSAFPTSTKSQSKRSNQTWPHRYLIIEHGSGLRQEPTPP